MKRIVNWLIDYWWVIPLFMVLQMFVILVVMYLLPGDWVELIVSILWELAAVVELLLLALLLFRKKWKIFFTSLALMLGIVFIMVPFSFLAMAAPDGYAPHHPIPEGMELNIPLDDEDAVVDSNDSDSFLQIYGSLGTYEYDLYYPQLSAGTIFLRCFEVGKNEQLSAESMEDRTSVGQSVVTQFSKVVEKQRFTIYEGDWEEYYAVRVEVWHRDSTTHQETKLLEKRYRMDGWMR